MEMTWKEKLADVISGGAVSYWRNEYFARGAVIACNMDAMANKELNRKSAVNALKGVVEDNAALRDHLRQIIHRGNTASPNSTVKAMVTIAKRGLRD